MSMKKNMSNEREYQREYNRANRITLSFAVRRDSKYPKIWDSIPNKVEFIKECLNKYEKEHKNE